MKEYCTCKDSKKTRHGACLTCGLVTKEYDESLDRFIEKVRRA